MTSIFEDFERELVDAARLEAGDSRSGRRSPRRLRRTSKVLRAMPAVGLVAVCLAAVAFAATSFHAHSPASSGSTGAARMPAAGSPPGQRLADGAIDCFRGTSGHGISAKTFQSGVPSSNGQDAITFCRESFADNGATRARAQTTSFVACEANATTVDVYVASGTPGQCARAGDRPLPSDYRPAIERLQRLERTLLTLQDAEDCVAPATLAREAKAALAQLGLEGWRVSGPLRNDAFPAGTGGTCGTFDASIAEAHDSANIDSARQRVFVSFAPPRSIATQLNHIEYELYTRTYEQCYTASSVRTLVTGWFATIKLRPRFATTARPKHGGVYEPASERLYQRGCVRFDEAVPTNDNRHVDVLLYAKGAAPGNEVRMPAADAYRP